MASTISTLSITGGDSSTVTVAGMLVTSFPVAVIMAVPAATAVTSPVSSTVATSVSSLIQVKSTSSTTMLSIVMATAVNRNMPSTMIIIEGGLTVTMATTGSGGGGSVTVSVAVPDTLSAVAVIIASPAPTPVAKPSASTEATISSELDHVNSASGISVPSDVSAFAANCCVASVSIIASDGLTVTLATTGSGGGGSATLIVTGELVMPSAVARTIAVPALTAVATPAEVMDTTLVSLLAQVKLTSPRTAPPAVRAVAMKVTVSPTINSWVEDGETVTLTTAATVTVIVTAALDTPLPVARMVAVPAATAVATPLLLMVTTAVLLLDQAKSTSLITVPSEALAVATNRWVLPTSTVAMLGLTSTTETVGAGGGGGDGVIGVGCVGESPPPQPAASRPSQKTSMARPVVIILYDLRLPAIT